MKEPGHEGGILKSGISALTGKDTESLLPLCSLPHGDTRRSPPENEEAGSHQTPSSELLSLQKPEKQMSAVKPPGLQHIYYSSLN